MTWFLSSWKTWWRHASTLSTLWTIFLSERPGYQMTFLKPLQTYTHESESRILTDSHVSSLSLFWDFLRIGFVVLYLFWRKNFFVQLTICNSLNFRKRKCAVTLYEIEFRVRTKDWDPHQFVVWQHAISVDRKVKCCCLWQATKFFFIRAEAAPHAMKMTDRKQTIEVHKTNKKVIHKTSPPITSKTL